MCVCGGGGGAHARAVRDRVGHGVRCNPTAGEPRRYAGRSKMMLCHVPNSWRHRAAVLSLRRHHSRIMVTMQGVRPQAQLGSTGCYMLLHTVRNAFAVNYATLWCACIERPKGRIALARHDAGIFATPGMSGAACSVMLACHGLLAAALHAYWWLTSARLQEVTPEPSSHT